MSELPNRTDAECWVLAERHRPLARAMAAKYAFGLDRDDGEQVALIAMYEATKTYDEARGAFATYARWHAATAVRKAVNDAEAIRLPLARRSDVIRLSRVEAQFSIVYGRSPTRAEWMVRPGVNSRALDLLSQFVRDVLSLEAPLGNDDSRQLREIIADDSPEVGSHLEDLARREVLERLLTRLSPEQSEIVRLHNDEGLTYEQASQRTGVDAATLAKRWERAIKTLQAAVSADADLAADLRIAS